MKIIFLSIKTLIFNQICSIACLKYQRHEWFLHHDFSIIFKYYIGSIEYTENFEKRFILRKIVYRKDSLKSYRNSICNYSRRASSLRSSTKKKKFSLQLSSFDPEAKSIFLIIHVNLLFYSNIRAWLKKEKCTFLQLYIFSTHILPTGIVNNLSKCLYFSYRYSFLEQINVGWKNEMYQRSIRTPYRRITELTILYEKIFKTKWKK